MSALGAAVLGLRARSFVGSKLCSSHYKLEFHLDVLRMSQKPSRERVVRLQSSVAEGLVVLLLGNYDVFAPALEFEVKVG